MFTSVTITVCAVLAVLKLVGLGAVASVAWHSLFVAVGLAFAADLVLAGLAALFGVAVWRRLG